MDSFDEGVRAANQASDKQNWSKALAAWHALLEDFPERADGFLGEAELLMRMGRLDEAEALLSGVIDRFSDQVYVAANHARIAAFRGDWAEALMRWGAVREKFPAHPIPYVGQGDVFLNIGQLDLAEAAFAKAIGLTAAFPHYEWAAIGYADVATRRGQWSEALERWEFVRTRFPKFGTAWVKYAEALDALGRPDEAKTVLRQASTLFPDTAIAEFPDNAVADRASSAAETEAPPAVLSKVTPYRQPGRFSAYLSIFNDWDILDFALRSVSPIVDELVIVDGAYKWMAPYLEAVGCDPSHSQNRVYEIIESAGIPYRVIANTWENEAEKRMAGYDACRNRYICRIDADEIMFPDHDMIELFLDEGAAAAEMEVPLYVSPGRIVSPREGPLPRAGFLFDSEQIKAADHLQYLWLISDQPQRDARPGTLFPEPVAFNAHLTHWRTPSTAIGRAAFYSLNYVRNEGAPWFSDLRSKPLPNLGSLFERIPPKVFQDTLKGSPVVAGYGELNDSMIGRSPVDATDEQGFYPLFDEYLRSHARQNTELTERGRYTLGRTYIDLSSPEALAALSDTRAISLRFSDKFSKAKIYLQYLVPNEPWEMVREIETHADGHQLDFEIPPEPSQFLRRVLRLDVWFESLNPVQRFIVER